MPRVVPRAVARVALWRAARMAVAELAVAIARELGLSQGRQEVLRIACILHDIGKITVPTEILSKPGRLNQLELNLVKGTPGPATKF